MRRAVGFNSYYEGAEDAGQAEHLQQWANARRREKRVQVIPKTELSEEAQIERLLRLMYLVGMPCAVLAAGLTIFLLITHFGWWTVPALLSAYGLHWAWGKAF